MGYVVYSPSYGAYLEHALYGAGRNNTRNTRTTDTGTKRRDAMGISAQKTTQKSAPKYVAKAQAKDGKSTLYFYDQQQYSNWLKGVGRKANAFIDKNITGKSARNTMNAALSQKNKAQASADNKMAKANELYKQMRDPNLEPADRQAARDARNAILKEMKTTDLKQVRGYDDVYQKAKEDYDRSLAGRFDNFKAMMYEKHPNFMKKVDDIVEAGREMIRRAKGYASFAYTRIEPKFKQAARAGRAIFEKIHGKIKAAADTVSGAARSARDAVVGSAGSVKKKVEDAVGITAKNDVKRYGEDAEFFRNQYNNRMNSIENDPNYNKGYMSDADQKRLGDRASAMGASARNYTLAEQKQSEAEKAYANSLLGKAESFSKMIGLSDNDTLQSISDKVSDAISSGKTTVASAISSLSGSLNFLSKKDAEELIENIVEESTKKRQVSGRQAQ